MANKKVSQLTSKPSVLTTDLFPIADPSTGQLYKTTISDLGTAIGSGVSSVNSLVGAVVLDTDDIQELVSPTNKWFTDTRARAALSASSPLTYNSGTGAFGIQVANGSQNGYLSSADWNTFNNKIGTGGGTITGATTFTNTVTLGTSLGDNQTLLNLPASNQLIYRENVGSLYGFNIESGVDNSLFLTNTEGGYYQTLYFGDSTGAYNIFGISTSSNSGSTWNPRLVINQNGYIGLNKNNPTEILDVNGNGLFSGNLTGNYLIGVSGGSFSGDVTITGTNPRLYFTDTDNNPDYFISNTDGTFTIYDVTNSTSRLTISTLNTTLNTNLRIEGDVLIKQDSVFGGVAGYTGIGSDSSGIFLKLGTATSHAYLVLSGLTSYRNFTLPDATGTFALTSDLGSYLPLSGGTLTGALSGTSATFVSTSATNNAARYNISIGDNSAVAAGNGGGILFRGVYTGTTLVDAAGISSFKANGTDGDYGYGLSFITRANGGDLTSRLTIASTGAATFSRNDAANVSVTIANAYLNQGNLINFQQNKAGSTINAYIGHGGDSTGNFIINNGTQALTITNAGNVGIGLTSPSELLTAAGNILVNGGNGQGFKLNGGLAIYRLAGDDLGLYTASTERMRITSAGNVGIGTTSTTSRLTIGVGTGEIEGLTLKDGSVNATSVFIYSSVSGENRIGGVVSYAFPTFYSGGSERMRITSVGHIQTNGNPVYAYSGSISIGGTYQTIFAAVSGGVYLVSVTTDSADGTFGLLTVINDPDKSLGMIYGNNISLQFSGDNVQMKSTNGSTYNTTWTATRLK